MAILVMCTNSECCEFFHVPNQAAGTEVCCPSCGTVHRIKAQPKTDASAATDEIGTAAPKGREETPPPDDKKPLPVPPSSSPSAPAAETGGKKIPPSLELEEDDDDEPFDFSSRTRPANPPTKKPVSVDTQEILHELEDIDDEPPMEDALEPDVEAPPSAARHPRPLGSSAPSNTPVKFTDMDHLESETYNAQSADPDTLDLKPSGAIILSIGLVGMLLGLTAGMFMFPWHPLLNAYLGGGLGWIMGFTIAFLLVGAHQKNPERMRCGLCGCVSSIHATSCRLCGAPLSLEESSPVLWTCLRAGQFGLKRWSYSISLVFYVALTYIIHWGLAYLWTLDTDTLQPWWPLRYAFDVLFLALLVSYSVRYFLAMIDLQYRTEGTMPKPPAYVSLSGMIQTVKILLMVAWIVLPLITLPLLPLGLLQQTSTGKYVPSWGTLVRTMRRYPKDFAILWLFLLLWTAGMILSVLLVFLIFNHLADFFALPGSEQPNLLQYGILTIRMAVATVAAYCMLSAICRCIGKFRRFCPFT